MFTKFSILVFYLRLNPKPGFRYSVFAVMFFVFGVSVGSMFAITFQCHPIAFAWDLSIKGTCMHRNAYYYANSALNIFSDFAIYFLAIPLVRTVQLPKRQKRGLYLVLGLGCLWVLSFIDTQISNLSNHSDYSVCVSGIIRMYTLHTVNHTVDSTCKYPFQCSEQENLSCSFHPWPLY